MIHLESTNATISLARSKCHNCKLYVSIPKDHRRTIHASVALIPKRSLQKRLKRGCPVFIIISYRVMERKISAKISSWMISENDTHSIWGLSLRGWQHSLYHKGTRKSLNHTIIH